MNEDALNMAIRKFLKKVGITSQREIEHAVQKALETGTMKGSETIELNMILEAQALGISHRIEGKITLE